MADFNVLASYLGGLIVLIGIVAYIQQKMSHGDEWGTGEKLVFAYVVVAVVVWLLEGYHGASPVAAIPAELMWPKKVVDWARRQGKQAGSFEIDVRRLVLALTVGALSLLVVATPARGQAPQRLTIEELVQRSIYGIVVGKPELELSHVAGGRSWRVVRVAQPMRGLDGDYCAFMTYRGRERLFDRRFGGGQTGVFFLGSYGGKQGVELLEVDNGYFTVVGDTLRWNRARLPNPASPWLIGARPRDLDALARIVHSEVPGTAEIATSAFGAALLAAADRRPPTAAERQRIDELVGKLASSKERLDAMRELAALRPTLEPLLTQAHERAPRRVKPWFATIAQWRKIHERAAPLADEPEALRRWLRHPDRDVRARFAARLSELFTGDGPWR